MKNETLRGGIDRLNRMSNDHETRDCENFQGHYAL